MNNLFDILLSKPIPDEWLHRILFTSFIFHILFVLLTLGTAILAVYYFINAWWSRKLPGQRWDKEILKTFMAHKTLAVVLGAAPLLLIQLGYSIPFFTGINLFAPYWLLIIILLIIVSLCLDLIGHKTYVHRYTHLILEGLGLISLLSIPAIFVLVLVASENMDKWLIIIKNSYHLDRQLAAHWLFRYLHVLGAAIIFGGTFHYFYTTKKDRDRKKSLSKWIAGGFLSQFIIGIMLYISLPKKPDFITNSSIIIGIFAAALLLWVIFSNISKGADLKKKTIFPLLIVILVSMLLSRQFIQDNSLIPFTEKLKQNASAYEKELDPYKQEAIEQYKADIETVYDNGETIYSRSCAFCHGANADGKGIEAENLSIPPEDVSSIRTNREYLHKLLVEGTDGSAMPYFSVFDRDKLYDLIDHLDKKYHVLSLPEQIPAKISKPVLDEANKIYAEACSNCHGADGKGSKLSEGFKPRPPDFTVYSLAPERAFDVVTNGYPGTMMPAFKGLSEDIRWGLVRVVYLKRIK